jgi:hypothetical protein
MHQRPSRTTLTISLGAIAVLAVFVAVLVARIPEVVGLGTRVKLPIFHGGSTWVDLMLFVLLAIAAIVYLVRRTDEAYSWVVGMRAVALPLWAVNSALGLIAALSTWDFTGSKQSPLSVARSDPRLITQFILLVGAAMVLILDWLVLEKRLHKAFVDVAYVGVAVVLVADIFLDPAKRALHPDSPVLHSGLDIQLPFYGIVAGWFAIMLIIAWLAHLYVRPEAVAASPAEAPSA